MEIKVNLIGAGRVGKTLLGLLQRLPGYTIQDVLSPRLQAAQDAVTFAGAGRAISDYAKLRPADLWIIATPDTQIEAAAASIADGLEPRKANTPAPIAFHCSGFFPAQQMAPLRDLGWHLASVHPVLSFADPKDAMAQFEGTYCGIEGDAEALKILAPLMSKLGAQPFEIRSDSKSLYHAAAVISNNFAVVLQAIARDAWAASGVPDNIAQQLNEKLLKATYENVVAKGPWEALTGPAARGDTLVVTQQGEDVARWDPAAGKLYKDLSRIARNLKAGASTGTLLTEHTE